jgi:A/G-specific adenine glycosylase
MLGWPGCDWTETDVEQEPPFEANWVTLPEGARHTFTHFHLRLRIQCVRVPNDIIQSCGHFVDAENFNVNDLPTVMRKVWKLVEFYV